MLVLGIETSCDETSASICDGTGDAVGVRSLVILSQDVHRIFGGVVPEIASRVHLTTLVPVVAQVLAEAGCEAGDIDAIAVTNAPGLVGALLVGVGFSTALAYALDIPCIGVHHMEGHLFAAGLEHPEAVPPFTALLVSGGHTLLLDVEAWGRYRLLGRTRDDAAGEAFDKVAKLLGLPYPGGPAVERLAASVGSTAYRFPRPMIRRNQQPADDDYYDFSFSGLKTAVWHAVREIDSQSGPSDPPQDAGHASDGRAAIARGFQDAVIDTLVEKTARAMEQFGRERLVLGGGVAGNRALAAALGDRARRLGAVLYAPSARLATDNAAMIARAGLFRLERGERSGLDLTAFASRPLPGLLSA